METGDRQTGDWKLENRSRGNTQTAGETGQQANWTALKIYRLQSQQSRKLTEWKIKRQEIDRLDKKIALGRLEIVETGKIVQTGNRQTGNMQTGKCQTGMLDWKTYRLEMFRLEDVK